MSINSNLCQKSQIKTDSIDSLILYVCSNSNFFLNELLIAALEVTNELFYTLISIHKLNESCEYHMENYINNNRIDNEELH
jgi:hypothetical protein